MPADSIVRRALKSALRPLLNERTYQLIQCAAKSWDIRTGSWSEPEIDLLPLAIRKGETAIDIGANYGLYCYHLSRAVGPSGRVYAFEPVTFTYETCRLVGKVLGLGNVQLYPKGCSDRTTRVKFTLPMQDSGAISAGLAHIAGRNDQREQKEIYSPYEATKEVWCEVVALDEFLPNLEQLSLIKCDIEGADLLALRGASSLIERHCPTILCEVEPWFLEGFGIPPQDVGRFFIDRGYQMYHYDVVNGRGALSPTSVEELGAFGSHNYVFVHPRRADRLASVLKSPPRVTVALER